MGQEADQTVLLPDGPNKFGPMVFMSHSVVHENRFRTFDIIDNINIKPSALRQSSVSRPWVRHRNWGGLWRTQQSKISKVG
ncbi:hypothetical protein [Flagellimonas marina]|uniref:Uncharacterized protein n=1 Tax=Flagellimonas marina TaxID=1775168 RepID=A0ABV8PRD3_9FLAO